ncbi:hypothetical protein FGW37_00165 [Streptomyces rectiverticillatus]|uniref:hypothetical protein n=1 Tax=Streptomyces rectiverticillatus TaxID=173860 RepID=UPI0015C2D7D5|nr:hypothetical protein [Streptomyces rectiverticillatus]QLE70241.1 hypothetical protein FGW37_00165 [Streptomyces rectiverticillatus]
MAPWKEPKPAFLMLRLAEDIISARDSPTTAAPGIARSIIRFVVNVIPDSDGTTDTLETIRDEHLERARTVHSGTGAYP